MKILLVVNGVFFNENMGVLSLSAVLKKAGHQTKLMILNAHNILNMLSDYCPDVIAYSAMTPNISNFEEADLIVQKWIKSQKKQVIRIMGGPHPTYFPEILNTMGLDAICVGEGEFALLKLVTAFEKSSPFQGINNIVPRGASIKDITLEIINDLDELPWIDRDLFYDAVPSFRYFKIRGFMTTRGCPYNCAYCFNNVFNKMFAKCGKIVGRRRSVDDVIKEILHVIKNYGPVKMIRFSDDTFVYRVDDWLRSLLKRYKKEVGLPFLCHLRSNLVTDEMVRLLREAGCCSVGMAIETADEKYRIDVLNRKITDEDIFRSYNILKKYGIRFQANCMLALPGTTLDDDMKTFEFSKKIRPDIATFGIFTPFPSLQLTEHALSIGVLDKDYKFSGFRKKSVLNAYQEEEKKIQQNMVRLGSIFCHLPDYCMPLFKKLIRLPNNPFYFVVGMSYMFYCYYRHLYWPAVPKSPFQIISFWRASLKYTD